MRRSALAPSPPASRRARASAGGRAQAQRGAALLVALLTVTLVATLAAATLWQQWRSTEVEAAERARLQSSWVLLGALDWSRLILREDLVADSQIAARGSGEGSSGPRAADHLGEPWAIPLEEVQLRSFLSAEQNVAADDLDGLPEAYLSGDIVDAQSKLNVRNLVSNGKVAPAALATFQRLFMTLGLPAEQVGVLAQALTRVWPAAAQPARAASEDKKDDDTDKDKDQADAEALSTEVAATGAAAAADAALTPRTVRDLVWLGLPLSTVETIAPYVTVLPKATSLNINTASPEVLAASSDKLDLAGAQRLVSQRQRSYFGSIEEANRLFNAGESQLSNGVHGVSTQYFEVRGRLRLDQLWVEERSLIYRSGANLQVLQRERGAGQEAALARLR